MNNSQGHFCPACNRKNNSDAVICSYCGAALIGTNPTTDKLSRTTKPISDKPIRAKSDTLIPEGGIAIFLEDTPYPIAMLDAEEFIIGRQIEGTLEETVDVSSYNAFSTGVSRRHALIRRKTKGFEIIDLGSTNGTWLNENRLAPKKAYPLPSGATIRLGQLRLKILTREGISF